jgi:succinate dehydrogenase assembly factor 2
MIRSGLVPFLQRVVSSPSSSSWPRRNVLPRVGVDGVVVRAIPQKQTQQTQQQQLCCRRMYRGDSGDAVRVLAASEEALLDVAQPKAQAMHQQYIQLPVEADDDTTQQVRRKRLVYRSKQRGWLEVDLLLGMWASENVSHLSNDELNDFEAFVNLETIDIYNVITLRMDVPDSMKREGGQGVVERIQEWARSSPLGKADKESYRIAKTESNLI